MKAYHNNPQLKAGMLEEMERHRAQDQIERGTYGRDFNGQWRGCAAAWARRNESWNKTRNAVLVRQSEKLLELMAAAPVA